MQDATEAQPTDAALAAQVLRALVDLLPERVPDDGPVRADDFDQLTRRLRPYAEARFLVWEAVRCAALGSPRNDVPSTWLEGWLAERTRSEVLALLLRAAEGVDAKPQGPNTPRTADAAFRHLATTLPVRFPSKGAFTVEELDWVLREAGTPRDTAQAALVVLGGHLRRRRLATDVASWLATTSREEVVAELSRAAEA